MNEYVLPQNETERLAALWTHGILESAPDPAYDSFASLAAEVCETPMAAVSIVDSERLWFKASVGIAVKEVPRQNAFCAHAICADGLTEVRDAARDPRFADNPEVVGHPYIRFYASIPLVDRDGFALGTLCAMDFRPRKLSNRQRELLTTLGESLVTLLETRRGIGTKGLDHLAMVSEGLEHSAEPAMISSFGDPARSDTPFRIDYVNRAFGDLFGYSLPDIVGKSPKVLLGPESNLETWGRIRATAMRGDASSELIELYSSRGVKRLIELRGRAIDASHRIAILRDVTAVAAAQASLLEANERLQSIIAHAPDPIFILDESGACVDMNAEATARFGCSKAELLEIASRRLATRGSFFPERERFPAELEAGRALTFAARYRHRAGHSLEFECRAIPIIVGGSTQGAYVIAKDVTDARRSAELLERHAERMQRQAERTHALYLIFAAVETTEGAQVEAALQLVLKTLDMQYGYVAVIRDGRLKVHHALGDNLAAMATGIDKYSEHMLRGLEHSDVVIVDDLGDGCRTEGVPTDHDWHGYIAARLQMDGKPWGALGFLSCKALAFDVFDWDFVRLVAALVATTLERHVHEDRLNQLAYYDTLTGLTNRAKFMNDLDAAVSLARRHDRSFALHFIDLDGFKAVNDRAGHAIGDLALQEAARRLQQASRQHDVPARLGGDEFVLLQNDLSDRSEALAFGHRIVGVLAQPYVLNGETFRLSASVGIATYPADGLDAGGLLREADVALYRAKGSKKNRVQLSQRSVAPFAVPAFL